MGRALLGTIPPDPGVDHQVGGDEETVTSPLIADFDTVEIVPDPPRDINLEILNGCGAGGAAKELTSILRNQGFAVEDFRNAESFDYAHTVVRMRNVDREKGEAFAAYLGCRNIVHEESDRTKADICIVVGEDWRDLAIVRGRDEARDSLTRMIDFFKKVTYFK